MKKRSAIIRFAKSKDGAQAVEFALVAPVLFAFLFGAFEVGRVMFTESRVAEAASDGARLATVYAKKSSNYSTAETTAVSNAVKNNFESARRSLVNVNVSDTAFNGQDFVKIDVTYNFSFLIHFGPFTNGLTISTTRYSPVL